MKKILLFFLFFTFLCCKHVVFNNKGVIEEITDSATITKDVLATDHNNVVVFKSKGVTNYSQVESVINGIVAKHLETGFYAISQDNVFFTSTINDDIKSKMRDSGIDSEGSYDYIISFFKKGVLTYVWVGEISSNTIYSIDEGISTWEKESKDSTKKYARFYQINSDGLWLMPVSVEVKDNRLIDGNEPTVSDVKNLIVIPNELSSIHGIAVGRSLVSSATGTKWTSKKDGSGTAFDPTNPAEGDWFAKYDLKIENAAGSVSGSICGKRGDGTTDLSSNSIEINLIGCKLKSSVTATMFKGYVTPVDFANSGNSYGLVYEDPVFSVEGTKITISVSATDAKLFEKKFIKVDIPATSLDVMDTYKFGSDNVVISGAEDDGYVVITTASVGFKKSTKCLQMKKGHSDYTSSIGLNLIGCEFKEDVQNSDFPSWVQDSSDIPITLSGQIAPVEYSGTGKRTLIAIMPSSTPAESGKTYLHLIIPKSCLSVLDEGYVIPNSGIEIIGNDDNNYFILVTDS